MIFPKESSFLNSPEDFVSDGYKPSDVREYIPLHTLELICSRTHLGKFLATYNTPDFKKASLTRFKKIVYICIAISQKKQNFKSAMQIFRK